MSGLKMSSEGRVTIIEPENYLDGVFKSQIESYLNGQEKWTEPYRLLFDLNNVELINSHGATTFYQVYDYLEEHSGKMAFCSVKHSLVEATLRDIGMYNILGDAFFNSRIEAIRALENDED